MNPLPLYYELLAGAWAASDQADSFDVDSGDEESAARFATLRRESTEAQIELISYVTTNANAIRRALSGDLTS